MNRDIRIPPQGFAVGYLIAMLAVILWEYNSGHGNLSGIFSIIVTLPGDIFLLPVAWVGALLQPIGEESKRGDFPLLYFVSAALLNFGIVMGVIRWIYGPRRPSRR